VGSPEFKPQGFQKKTIKVKLQYTFSIGFYSIFHTPIADNKGITQKKKKKPKGITSSLTFPHENLNMKLSHAILRKNRYTYNYNKSCTYIYYNFFFGSIGV
jgi:IS1 family transposase